MKKLGLEENVCGYVGRILDKDISKFQKIESGDNSKINVLSGMTKQGGRFTEFHFGAGESSIIRMVSQIEKCEENALILIEEIENGLHPLAVRRLVEYLIDVSIRRKVQVVFTTHSEEALKPLPDKAIWVCANENNEIFQGKLRIESLRALVGEVPSELVVYVEDVFAQRWVETVLSLDKNISSEAIMVCPMEGDGRAVKINKSRNEDPAAKYKSVCYIDGDSNQSESSEDRVFRLPGEMPESYIFLSVLENFDFISNKLVIALHQEIQDKDFVKEVLDKVWRTTYDKHNIYNSIALELGYMQEETIRSAFLHTWCELFESERKTIYENIVSCFPE